MENFIKIVHESNGLFLISIIVVFGLLCAIMAKKIKLPSVTGYMFAGIILGEEFLGLLPHNMLENFDEIHSFGLGMMSLSIGAHINYHKLRNSWKRVTSIAICQILCASLFVFLSFYFFSEYNFPMLLLIAGMSVSTAPATMLSVVKETKAKGPFVETLMPVVAFNDISAILLFSALTTLIMMNYGGGFNIENIMIQFIHNIIFPIVLGITFGFILKYFSEKVINSTKHVLLMVFVAVSITTSVANILGLNIMLANMSMGALIINTSFHRKVILDVFEEIELFVVIIFFTIAGAHMHLSALPQIFGLVLLYYFVRMFGVITGATIGAKLVHAPKRIVKNIGLALVPQATVVIGLVLMAKKMTVLHQYINIEALTTFALGTIILNEISGPVLSKFALKRSGDADNQNPKLIDFIQEEYINHNLKATDKESAIIELTSFLIESHKATNKQRDNIIKTVLLREKEASTAIGLGIAIPHGVISDGPQIWGAIGVSKKGIDFSNANDKSGMDQNVNIMILIVTPQKYKDSLHLTVLQEVSVIFSASQVREKVINANSALEVYEVLKDFQQSIEADYALKT